jgi:hypothetical protein
MMLQAQRKTQAALIAITAATVSVILKYVWRKWFPCRWGGMRMAVRNFPRQNTGPAQLWTPDLLSARVRSSARSLEKGLSCPRPAMSSRWRNLRSGLPVAGEECAGVPGRLV